MAFDPPKWLSAPRPWALLALVAVVLSVTPAGETTFPDPISTPPRYLAIAHRGAPLRHAENTIPALEEAARLGAGAVEVDLCITADDRVVLWHDVDPTSWRATARQLGIGPVPHDPDAPFLGAEHRALVSALTLRELRAHYGYDDADARIPTLATFLDWLERTPSVDAVFLDLKDDDRVRDTLRHVVAGVRDRELSDRTFYALNTTPHGIREMQTLLEDHPDLPIHPMFDGKGSIMETVRELGVRHVSLGKRVWEPMPLFVEHLQEPLRARRRGELDTGVVWTFDERGAMRSLYRLGVDGIMSNQVERLVEVRRSMGDGAPRYSAR